MEDIVELRAAFDASPTTVLASLRGPIVDARIAYPDVLHVEVRGSSGELWRLATQDAEWWPPDPRQLMGRSIDDAEIAEQSGGLRCRLSDGSVLAIRPTATEKADGPPYWELIGPSGMALEFGPGIRWQISLGGLGDRGPRGG